MKRRFQREGSTTSNRTSGKTMPITRQYSGVSPSAGTATALSTVNSKPVSAKSCEHAIFGPPGVSPEGGFMN